MSPITTHVLDTAAGRPAVGVPITLELQEGSDWKKIGGGMTNEDGRLPGLLPDGHTLAAGTYRMTFDTGRYLKGGGFYPFVPIVFRSQDPDQHYHVPLLLSPYGYSTYRGS